MVVLANARPITEADMLLDWGRAEADGHIKRGWPLPPEIEARVVSGAALLELERLRVITHLTRVRIPLLAGLISVGLQWVEADLPVGELATLHLIDIPEFDHRATIGDLAAHRTDIGKRNFDPTKMRGHPIIVGATHDGPFLLIEGTNRCCDITRLHQASAFAGDTVRVIAGIGSPAPLWWLWR